MKMNRLECRLLEQYGQTQRGILYSKKNKTGVDHSKLPSKPHILDYYLISLLYVLLNGCPVMCLSSFVGL